MLAWKILRNDEFLREFFNCSQIARGCQRIIEKTPTNATVAHLLRRVFPDSPFVYIIRHPVEVFSSYRKLVKKLGTGCWSDLNVAEFCNLYRRRVSSILRFANRDTRFLLIKYEDFVKNPSAILKSLCLFIQEDYEMDMLNHTLSDRESSNDRFIKGPICQSTKLWSDWITESQALEVQKNLRRIMKKLAYNSIT